MGLDIVRQLLDDANIDFQEGHNVITCIRTNYKYDVSFNEDDSSFIVQANTLDENSDNYIEFIMKMYPMHFMYTKTYFSMWFSGVVNVMSSYYMDKGI